MFHFRLRCLKARLPWGRINFSLVDRHASLETSRNVTARVVWTPLDTGSAWPVERPDR